MRAVEVADGLPVLVLEVALAVELEQAVAADDLHQLGRGALRFGDRFRRVALDDERVDDDRAPGACERGLGGDELGFTGDRQAALSPCVSLSFDGSSQNPSWILTSVTVNG